MLLLRLPRRLPPPATAAAAATRLFTARPAPAADDDAALTVPGGSRVPFTHTLTFVGGRGGGADAAAPPVLPAYRTLTSAGAAVPDAAGDDDLSEADARSIHASMVTLQTMDALFYECQRQGRFSFYMTCAGEEATAVGSAAGLASADPVFAQYREQGVLLHRGWPLRAFADQCLGSEGGHGKGRQMPIHYGSVDRAFHTISSPLATQLPHAVGHAHALAAAADRAGRPVDTVAACYFGDGAASEGDAHAAFNFAATLRAPVVFICRNNGWAISTPTTEQYAGDGIAGRGPGYGIPTARVDGGDARAVALATRAARRLALSTRGPVLLECVAHRAGHHSTSDDASRYRGGSRGPADPVARFAAWLESRGWWDADREAALRRSARGDVLAALADAEGGRKASVASMFDDVYDAVPPHLAAQRDAAVAAARAHPELVPKGAAVE
jgi:2-oxoisovalerate dehydrogenase E1 component alpha subunit